jgi:hypothetical protein
MTRMTLAAAISAIAIGALSACHSMGSARDSNARGGTSMSGSGEVSDRASHPQGAVDSPVRNPRGEIWSR